MGYISLYSLPSESTWRDKNGKDKNLHALHEWLICFPPLSFYSFIFISLHLRCRSTSFSKYQTPRNIQTFSNRCNLPKAARTHTLAPLRTNRLTLSRDCEISLSISASPSATVFPCSLSSAWLTGDTIQCVHPVGRPKHICPPLLALNCGCQGPASPQSPSVK